MVAETPNGLGIEVLVTADNTKLWLAHPRRYRPALVLATGSSEHIGQLQARAQSQELRFDERGLFQGRRLIPCLEEQDVHAALDLPRNPAGLINSQLPDYFPPWLQDKQLTRPKRCRNR